MNVPHFARLANTLERRYLGTRLGDLTQLVGLSGDSRLVESLRLLNLAPIFLFGNHCTLTDGTKFLTHHPPYPARGLAQVFGRTVPDVPPSNSSPGTYYSLTRLPDGHLYWQSCSGLSLGCPETSSPASVILTSGVIFHPVQGLSVPLHEGAHFAARKLGLLNTDAERYSLEVELALLQVARREMPVEFHESIDLEIQEVRGQIASL